MEYVTSLSLPIVLILLRIIERTSTEPLMFAASCDNNLEIYTDGVLRASSQVVENVSTFVVADCPAVAAVYCEDVGGVGGIIASFGNSQLSESYVTDASWVCLATTGTPPTGWNTAGFDDSTWGNAVVVPARFFRSKEGITLNFPEIDTEADWIWSTLTIGLHRKVYCRKSIRDCGESDADSTSTTEQQTTQAQTTPITGTVELTTVMEPPPTTATVESLNCYSRNPCVHIFNSNYRPYFPHETAGKFIWCTPAGECHPMNCSEGRCPRVDPDGNPPETHQSGSYTCQRNNPCDPSVNQSTFPHDSPTKLIQCGQGTDCFETSCSPGLLWNPTDKTCSYP